MFLKNVRRKLIAGVRNLSSNKSSSSDHYDTLKVSRSATQSEIKNAYFELTKQYHPDKVKATDESLAKFRNITEAYEILGNVESRRQYDKGAMSDSDVSGPPPEEAEEEDPLQKFYRFRREQEFGATFDAWTAEQTQKMRKQKADMKAAHEHFQQSIKEDKNKREDMTPITIITLIVVAVFVIHNLSSTPGKFNNNKIETRVENNKTEPGKDKRYPF